MFNYYLGWVKDQSIATHIQLIPDAQVAYAKQWGMNTEIEDLRRVVLRASKLGGKVVVGGHSLGGTITTAYATWDFHGRTGADGLAGLVFIDGGSGPTPTTRAAATKSLADLAAGSPWLQFGGIPTPFAGLFNSTGALSVLLVPTSPSLAQASGLLPAGLVPPVPVTNAGQYGYALDTETSPSTLAAAQAHLGHLASSGDPRGWDDAGELTPLRRMAEAFGGWGLQGLDGTAWYHPLRLTIDAGAVAAGRANPAQKVLDVHATHGDDLPRDLKLYAFAAGLGGDARPRRRQDPGQAVAHPGQPSHPGRPPQHLRPQRPQHRRALQERVPQDAGAVLEGVGTGPTGRARSRRPGWDVNGWR